MYQPRIAILISGTGTNMEELLRASITKELPAQVSFVGSDNLEAKGLMKAAALGASTRVFFYKRDGRSCAEEALAAAIEETHTDWIVLAGFMRILSPEFVRRFAHRIINIHPALLPAFPGAHGIRDAWEAGVAETGVTVHIVDEEVDHGPILAQQSVRREADDTIETLEAKIHAVEHKIYKLALKEFLENHPVEIDQWEADKVKKMETRKALISVWDKTGVLELARGLAAHGYEIVSSSGTAKHLEEGGVKVTEVVDMTGLPAILGGRVKTLHPTIMGGILARRGVAQDDEDREKFNIPLIDVVVCTLYPFEETAKSGADLDHLIEKIDIGGVSLIRAGAKNYYNVAVITDIDDYGRVLDELEKKQEFTLEFKQELALKAFRKTASYDAVIYRGLCKEVGAEDEVEAYKVLPLEMKQKLRYGENPHQKAALFMPPLEESPFEQLSGKELSYNNLLDLDTLLRGCSVFQDACACTIVKHTTPCGTAMGASPIEAFKKALACDPVSAFGGIIGMTRKVDLETAKTITETFFEILAAPEFEEGVVDYLKEKKPNLRVLKLKAGYAPKLQLIGNRCGYLAQEDKLPALPTQQDGKWHGTPRPELWDDIIFAWKTAAITKSNAIVLVKDGAAVGIGGGFTNRVDAAEYAMKQAGDKARGSVLASDAFFPFADSVELAAKAGVTAVIEPGGSIRDDEVIQKAEELGLSLFIGGTRTFRH
ncbi:MAG: bifunctional phosphoribosylaminoimidazolecarboxamide formyltransferase/IMP cyclohydrolase [Cloacibacillus sp.]